MFESLYNQLKEGMDKIQESANTTRDESYRIRLIEVLCNIGEYTNIHELEKQKDDYYNCINRK
jgi:hypothetical protein